MVQRSIVDHGARSASVHHQGEVLPHQQQLHRVRRAVRHHLVAGGARSYQGLSGGLQGIEALIFLPF